MRAFIDRSGHTSIKSFCAGFAILLLTCGAAGAATVTATIGTGLQSGNLGNAGSFRLFAYSQQYRSLNPPIAPLGPNATKSITTVIGGVAGTRTPVGGPSIIVSTGVVGQNQAQLLYGDPAKLSERTIPYGPTITTGALRKAGLALAGDNVTITSTSGNYSAEAKAFITANGARRLSANATGTPPPGGQSAAEAQDPYHISSGTQYAYDPILSGSVNLDVEGLAGGISAYALDSHVFTLDDVANFNDDGAPLNDTLWYLSIGAARMTNGLNVVVVDFELNPLALDEIIFTPGFLSTLGPYGDPQTEALLIGQALGQAIASQLALNGTSVDLANASLFPAGTLFQAYGSGVDYADGVQAALMTAPEPVSLALFGAGLILMVLLGRRRSGRREETARPR